MKILSNILLFFLTLLWRPFRGKTRIRQYTIAAGRHYSGLHFHPFHISKAIHFMVVFDQSCIYTSTIAVDQYDINKLFGFSEYLFSDQKESARIGWNYREGKLYLRPFTHVHGAMIMDPPEVEVEIGKGIPCSISLGQEAYLFTINGKEYSFPRQGRKTSINALMLYPYFGGNEPAPHSIRLWLYY